MESSSSEPQKVAEVVYRHHSYEKEGLKTQPNDKVKTLYDNLVYAVEVYPDKTIYAWKETQDGEYKTMTFAQAKTKIEAIGSYLCSLGLKEQQKVGLWSINRKEWDMGEQACNMFNFVCVPLYASIGQDVIEYVINHSETSAILCQESNLEGLFAIIDKVPIIKHVICMDACDDEKISAYTAKLNPSSSSGSSEKSDRPISFIDFERAVKIGAESKVPPRPPQPTDCASITYTSGTTGKPKGVVSTHINFVSSIVSIIDALKDVGYNFTPKDRCLSWLTTAHIYGRVLHAAMAHCGAALWYYGGDFQKLFADSAQVKPTFFTGVPRIYTKLRQKIQAGLEEKPALIQYLFKNALYYKQQALKNDTTTWWDFLFRRLRAKLGLDECNYFISGAAPLPAHDAEFLQTVFCPVIQGYGLTETTASSSASASKKKWIEPGTIGMPLSTAEFKLVSVPEMDYSATGDPPQGELCIRGPGVFSGYYKSPEKTREVLDPDGWFHTGDIGTFDGNSLRVIDRKKNIFKLSQGEYVSAPKIEGIYMKSFLIAQIFVHGSSERSYLVAVVVPEFANCSQWISSNAPDQTPEELAKNPKFIKFFQQKLDTIAKESSLHKFEYVKKIHIDHRIFDEERNLMTPSQKMKRPQLRKYYQEEFNRLYGDSQ